MHTGLRQSELLNLRWNDVDLSACVLVIKEAKSGEGRRIPFNSVVQEVFSRMKRARNIKRKRILDPQKDAIAYVFRSKEGGVLHNLRRTWGSALRRAKIVDFRFHDLRHTFASRFGYERR